MSYLVPTSKELRQFGLVMGAAFIVVFGLVLPWLFGRAWPVWPYYVAGTFAVIALVAPRGLVPAHRAWMAVGHLLGWVNTRIILGALFYLLVLPIGLVMRLLGKSPIPNGRDSSAESYRRPSARKADRKSMEKPF